MVPISIRIHMKRTGICETDRSPQSLVKIGNQIFSVLETD